jgi:uncharacterized membrane protein YtjA (UPF0391 family)
MMRLRLFLLSVAMIFAALVFVGIAGADPSNAKNAAMISATNCTDGNSYTVWVNGNGKFNAAHVADGTATFVPTALELTFNFYAPDNTLLQTSSEDAAKTAPQSNTMTCDIPLQTPFTAPDGSYGTIEGTVTGFLTPQG